MIHPHLFQHCSNTNAVIPFIFIGDVDVVSLNDINISVSFLNPKNDQL
jgi:hypothetical protein